MSPRKEKKELKLCSYPNPPLYLDGDCTDVATVGMAVAVSILVALVTACVRVGPPRAELAACDRKPVVRGQGRLGQGWGFIEGEGHSPRDAYNNQQ